MIGIYKIKSPTNKIYIGQSVDINRRFNQYELLNCKDQPALYNSLLKHGVSNHDFIILESCKVDVLNDRERFYQEKYNAVKNGLNCKYVSTKDKTGFYSEETKNKIRLSAMGNKYTLGYKHTEESKAKISAGNKGKRKGFVISEKQKKQHSLAMMNGNNPKSVKVINQMTMEVFDTIKQAAESQNIPPTTLANKLKGYRLNDTNFRYK